MGQWRIANWKEEVITLRKKDKVTKAQNKKRIDEGINIK